MTNFNIIYSIFERPINYHVILVTSTEKSFYFITQESVLGIYSG